MLGTKRRPDVYVPASQSTERKAEACKAKAEVTCRAKAGVATQLNDAVAASNNRVAKVFPQIAGTGNMIETRRSSRVPGCHITLYVLGAAESKRLKCDEFDMVLESPGISNNLLFFGCCGVKGAQVS